MASDESQIQLIRSENTRLTVRYYGATVTSWICDGKEILFLSKEAVLDNKKAIRGGIPLVFPHFGPWDQGPQHGFARINKWTLDTEPSKDADGNVTAVFSLTDNEATRKIWNHGFKLLLTVTLLEKSLKLTFQVLNTCSDQFDFTCLLHTYFLVNDVTECTLSGLSPCYYKDKVKDFARFKEDRDLVLVKEHTDRIYETTPDEHKLTSVSDGSCDIMIRKNNLPDTVVWNPWSEGAKAMGDFGNTEYPQMLCVEAGYVSESKVLKPGEQFTASQTLDIIRSSL